MPDPVIKIIDSPEEMTAVEELQRAVWHGSETDVVPAHMFIAAIHNGGLVIGAYVDNQLIGFVFGFPGLESYVWFGLYAPARTPRAAWRRAAAPDPSTATARASSWGPWDRPG